MECAGDWILTILCNQFLVKERCQTCVKSVGEPKEYIASKKIDRDLEIIERIFAFLNVFNCLRSHQCADSIPVSFGFQ